MARAAFDKTFLDLHGVDPEAVIEGEVIGHRPRSAQAIRANSPSFRPSRGRAGRRAPFSGVFPRAWGLFSRLMFVAVLLAMVGGGGFFLWAFFAP